MNLATTMSAAGIDPLRSLTSSVGVQLLNTVAASKSTLLQQVQPQLMNAVALAYTDIMRPKLASSMVSDSSVDSLFYCLSLFNIFYQSAALEGFFEERRTALQAKVTDFLCSSSLFSFPG